MAPFQLKGHFFWVIWFYSQLDEDHHHKRIKLILAIIDFVLDICLDIYLRK